MLILMVRLDFTNFINISTSFVYIQVCFTDSKKPHIVETVKYLFSHNLLRTMITARFRIKNKMRMSIYNESVIANEINVK